MLYIGKLVNTHGIKGEVKIISNFKYKEKSLINIYCCLQFSLSFLPL